jgi:hypothetical protein
MWGYDTAIDSKTELDWYSTGRLRVGYVFGDRFYLPKPALDVELHLSLYGSWGRKCVDQCLCHEHPGPNV